MDTGVAIKLLILCQSVHGVQGGGGDINMCLSEKEENHMSNKT